MRALVYHGPGQKSWDDVPDPKIVDDLDAIVQVDTVTICGTDLHILKGDVPEVEPGRILGHEAVGTVVETGAGVRSVREGDRLLLSCISACGHCRFCRESRYGQCLNGGGWQFGHLIDGVQAEYARVPFVDTSTYRVPDGLTDEQVLYLADILPTGYEVGVLNGRIQPGDTVVIVGMGPIGLATILGAQLYSPGRIIAVDTAATRLQWARTFGAHFAVTPDAAADLVAELTDGLGADVTVEAVGVPSAFEQCVDLVRAGGHVANVGVHGVPATLHLERLWIRDVTITTGLVDTFSTPKLLSLVESGLLDARPFTTHRFALEDALEAYDVFSDAGETNSLKVAMSATAPAGDSRQLGGPLEEPTRTCDP